MYRSDNSFGNGFCMAFAAAAIAFTACTSHAGVIIAPVSVSASSVFDQGPPIRLGDQSGLSANYVSGVTDFDAFLATTTHLNNNSSNSWSGDTNSEFTDFDFGSSIDLTRLALFGDNSPNGNNIMDFTVLIGNDPTFASSTNLGSFTALDTNSNPIGPQVFDVADGAGRYVRLQLDSNHGGSFGLNVLIYGEAVFEGAASPPGAVPEPTSFAIFGLGLICAGATRRKRR